MDFPLLYFMAGSYSDEQLLAFALAWGEQR